MEYVLSGVESNVDSKEEEYFAYAPLDDSFFDSFGGDSVEESDDSSGFEGTNLVDCCENETANTVHQEGNDGSIEDESIGDDVPVCSSSSRGDDVPVCHSSNSLCSSESEQFLQSEQTALESEQKEVRKVECTGKRSGTQEEK